MPSLFDEKAGTGEGTLENCPTTGALFPPPSDAGGVADAKAGAAAAWAASAGVMIPFYSAIFSRRILVFSGVSLVTPAFKSASC